MSLWAYVACNLSSESHDEQGRLRLLSVIASAEAGSSSGGLRAILWYVG